MEPFKGSVRVTKEYIDELRKKLAEMHLSTREDLAMFKETLTALRETVITLRGAATKDDLQNLTNTLKTFNETMNNIRQTAESVRRTVEAIRDIMIITGVDKTTAQNLLSSVTQMAIQSVTEQLNVDKSLSDAKDKDYSKNSLDTGKEIVKDI